VLPGVIGCLQANEALKLIAGYGEPLVGRLLTFDAQSTRFAEVRVRRDPKCPSCGDRAKKANESEVAHRAFPAAAKAS
jgi:sulfur-carrier protein adenylyltransferase/sulfurtransferase